MYRAEQSIDYKTQNLQFIREAIQKKINEGIKRFAIFPMGFWGKEVQTMLKEEFDIKPRACFDNFIFHVQNIHPADTMKSLDLSDTVLLIAIENEKARGSLYQQAAMAVPDAFIEVIPLCNEEKKRIFEEQEKVHLDFLCAGFHKCGTTSLQAALQKNENIYLPDVKETFFAMEVNEPSYKKFRQSYPDPRRNKKPGMLFGGIEPTYPGYAASIYRYFGADLKILFLVRNPAEALKSAFKMSIREIDGRGFELVKKYKEICPELMQEYIETEYKRFWYIDFIRLYERFYPETQIKIVLAEELIQNPSEQMDAIQEFIGLPEDLRTKYDVFPHANKGDTVFRDLGGAYVNHALYMLRMCIDDASLYLEIDELRKKMFDFTTEDFDFTKYNDIWEMVYSRYYADSVKALEERIGKSLEGIWY